VTVLYATPGSIVCVGTAEPSSTCAAYAAPWYGKKEMPAINKHQSVILFCSQFKDATFDFFRILLNNRMLIIDNQIIIQHAGSRQLTSAGAFSTRFRQGHITVHNVHCRQVADRHLFHFSTAQDSRGQENGKGKVSGHGGGFLS